MRRLETIRHGVITTFVLAGLLACGSNPGSGEGDVAEFDSETDDTGSDVAVPDVAMPDVAVPDVAVPDVAVSDTRADVAAPDSGAGQADVTEGDAAESDTDVDAQDATDAGMSLRVEDCDNGLDDDGDGAVDDADDDCAELRVCALQGDACEAGDISCWSADSSSDCADGTDDDGDGLVDCDDPDCAEDANCRPLPCVNGGCALGEECNRWNGQCQPNGSPYPPEGADIGDRCERDDQCRSDGHAGGPRAPVCNTNWENGYCMGFCTTCDDHWTGTRIPRRECAAGTVCLPPDSFSRDSTGSCVQECTSDAECRSDGLFEQYYCRREFWVDGESITFENGYCAPTHCQSRGCSGWVCGC